MAAEMRELERRQEELDKQIAAAGVPEPVPMLHPNLPTLYRRRVETLEEALADPATSIAATEALRKLIDAILVFPGERRGEVTVSLRGDLAAFLHAAEQGADTKKAALRVQNGCSWEVMGTLDAGTRIGLCRTSIPDRLLGEARGLDGSRASIVRQGGSHAPADVSVKRS